METEVPIVLFGRAVGTFGRAVGTFASPPIKVFFGVVSESTKTVINKKLFIEIYFNGSDKTKGIRSYL